MAQSNVIMAFRKRLRKKGYKDIHICLTSSGSYLIQAIEPLAGFGVQVEMSEIDLYLFR